MNSTLNNALLYNCAKHQIMSLIRLFCSLSRTHMVLSHKLMLTAEYSAQARSVAPLYLTSAFIL